MVLSRLIIFISFFVVLCVVSFPAPAQQADVPGFRPGREHDALKDLSRPRAMPDISVPEGGGAAVAPEAEEIKFELLGLMIDGSTIYKDEELKPLYQPLLEARTVSLADLYRLADAITIKYRDDGYLLSKSIVPVQRIKNGFVRIQVIEGFINKVGIQSDTVAQDSRIRDTLMPYLNRLTDERPVRIQSIERNLLLINDLAGVNGRAVLRPSPDAAVPGAAELILVLNVKSATASVTVDNYGSKYTGPIQSLAEATLSSPLGLGERLTVRGLKARHTAQLKYYQLEASVPIGDDGLTGHASYAHSASWPGFLLEPLEVYSRTWVKELSLSYPFLRSQASNVTGQIGFRHRNVSTDILGSRFSEDRTRTLFFNTVYDFADSWSGANLISLTFTQGISVWDATPLGGTLSSRPEAKPVSRKLGGELTRRHEIGGGFSAIIGGEWQYGFGAQPSAEEFVVGGKTTGRGYDSGEISGDRGVSGKAELHYRNNPTPSWLPAFDVYGFYDVGIIWNWDDVDKATANEKRSLASAGMGVQVPVQDWFLAKLEIAKPLTRTPASRVGKDEEVHKNPRVYASINIKF